MFNKTITHHSTNETFILIAHIILAYSTFYTIRLNFSFSIPALIGKYQITKTEIGFILSLFSIVYGLGKTLSGIVSDSYKPEKLLLVGLTGSTIINVLMPHCSTINQLQALVILNAMFQSLGWPTCVGILNKKFRKKDLGIVWGLCNASHAIGSSLIALSAGFILHYFSWEYLFYFPSFFTLITICILLKSSILSHKCNSVQQLSFKKSRVILNNVVNNPVIWLMSFGTMFLYIVRMSFLNWLPLYLTEYKGLSISQVGIEFSGFEIFGIFGGIVGGYFADKYGKSMIGMFFTLFLFFVMLYSINSTTKLFEFSLILFLTGFLVYGAQVLAGLIANDAVLKESVSTTTGLVGTFAYVGASFSGLGVGYFIDFYGWGSLAFVLLISAFLCCICYIVSVFYSAKKQKLINAIPL